MTGAAALSVAKCMAKTKLTTLDLPELTDKQRRFVYEYTEDYNATRAAEAAGYKSPSKIGSTLLNRVMLKHYLGEGSICRR